ncbi:MAG TPA: elongation factor G [Candidatus Sulfomarinibacteraceae bacterium]|nr:elongation factor G [Candidatus Sulfomarinibacteraceae bacterium]
MSTTFSTEQIRNVAVTGHSHTGKTSLVSALLFDSGTVNRLLKVDDGNTVTDFDEDEQERKITINTAVAHFAHRGAKVNLIDTPGYSIYTTDAIQGLRVADATLLLVSAVAGPEVQTDKMWKVAAGYELPVLFGVNLMDRDRASFARTLESLEKKYGREVTPVQVPIGEESSFAGLVDLISGKAYTWPSDDSGAATEAEIPADLADEVATAREALMEMVAEQDEALMEAYLEAGELDHETFVRGLKKAVASRSLFPVFALSGGKNIGVQPVMDALVDLVPSPDWRSMKATVIGEASEVSAAAEGPFAAYVFKTISDPYTGRITIMRVFSGGVATDANVANPVSRNPERLGALSVIQGKELEHVSELAAGDIGAVPKLKDTHTGDTLCAAKQDIVFEPVAIPEAAISFALEPKSKGDEDKLAAALAKIRDEDPTISFGRDPQTKEQLISGTGQLHVEVVVGRLKKRYKVDVLLHQPKVPYRETISASAEVTTRHKKQTGGSGQFAECKIMMEPNPGEGYEFVDKIFGGSISQGYRPAVDKGIQEAAERGVLAGFPMVDFKVLLLDGKEHSVDSSEMAFKIAGRKAFKTCAAKCNPTLLEPIMQIEVFTPEDAMGDVMGDLNSRRGRVQGMDSEDGTTTVRAQAPLAELLTYAPTLRSITGGRGDFHMEFSHYAEVPKQLQEKIIAAAAREDEDEDE